MKEKKIKKEKMKKKKPKKPTSNRGRKKRPPTEEEIKLEKERERMENDEFKEFRDLIEPIESKIKFEEEQKKAAQRASRSRKKKNEPQPKSKSKSQPKKRNVKNVKKKNDEFTFDLSDIDMNPEKSYYINLQEEDVKNSPGLFIILIDQTFSMQGEGLAYLKDSLKKLLAIYLKALTIN